MSVLMEFAMFPTSEECRSGSGVSKQVSKVIDMIDKSGYNYKLTPMGTIVETEKIKDALKLVEDAYEVLEDCDRVYSVVKFDIRKSKKNRMTQKINSVEKELGFEVKS